MAAITDFNTLQSEIRAELARNDSTITDRVDRFIQQAENYFNRKLRVQDMETSTTITQVSGNRLLSLPSDYVKLRNLQYAGRPNAIRYVTPQQQAIMSELGAIERPKTFTIINRNQIQFTGTPDAEEDMVLIYFQRIPSLSVTETTNWLLNTHPDVYLYRALHHAFKFLRNEEEAARYQIMANEIIEEIREVDEEDNGSGAGMHPRIEGFIV